MVNEPVADGTCSEGLLQGIEGQADLERRRHMPANDGAREDVDDERDIDKAGPRGHIRQVRHPELVRRRRRELAVELDEHIPDHSTLSRTRTRLPSEIYERVFDLVLGIVNQHGLLEGKVLGVDSTYLRADASMKSIVRRDTGEGYNAYLERLAMELGGCATFFDPLDQRAARPQHLIKMTCKRSLFHASSVLFCVKCFG
jgi:hypothetical protein